MSHFVTVDGAGGVGSGAADLLSAVVDKVEDRAEAGRSDGGR